MVSSIVAMGAIAIVFALTLFLPPDSSKPIR